MAIGHIPLGAAIIPCIYSSRRSHTREEGEGNDQEQV